MDNKQQQRKPDAPERPVSLTEGVEADTATRPANQKAHQKAITRGLKTFFDAVASEPVPDDFMALLKKMDGGAE